MKHHKKFSSKCISKTGFIVEQYVTSISNKQKSFQKQLLCF